LFGSVASELNQLFAIKFRCFEGPKFSMEHFESSAFGAPRRLPNVLHVVNVQVDQIAEGLGAPGSLSDRFATTVNLIFGLGSPFPRMIVPKECLCYIMAFAPNLDAP
jgi:hypothetical protein